MKPLICLALVCCSAIAASQTDPPAPAGGKLEEARYTVERLLEKPLRDAAVKAVSRDGVEVSVDGTALKIAFDELEQIRREESLPEPENPFLPAVTLQNGSQLAGTGIKVANRVVEVTTAWGTLSLPVAEVRSLRLAGADEKMDAAWGEMLTRESKQDLLVVRKGDALDFVAGVVGEVSDKDVKLLVGGRQAPVPRERVFGVVYVQQTNVPRSLCEVVLGAGDRLRVSEVGLAGDQLVATIGGASRVSIPMAQIEALDFTLGKVKSLADLPMTQSQFAKSPLLTASAFEVRKNRNSLGRTLRIGDREFPKGLWMHSGASAVFRLGREYRRLTTTIGIDSNSTELPRIAPKVRVVFNGDGKAIETREVAWNDAPTSIEVDVTGVRELEVRVEPLRETPGVLEHLVLGEARVIQ